MKRMLIILVAAASALVAAQQVKPHKVVPITEGAVPIPYTAAEPKAGAPRKAAPYRFWRKPQRFVKGGATIVDKAGGDPEAWQGDGYAYVPVLFDGNWNLGQMLMQGNTVPNPDSMLPPDSGLLFDGVPFYLGQGHNIWSAYHVPGEADPHELNLPVGLPDALEVHTVINSLGGVPNKEMLWLEFKSTCGLVYRVAMRGNRDIRDWRDGGHSNLIAAPTVQVWGHGLARLDMQSYKLPKEFQGSEKLASIRIIDGGSNGSQRVVLVGVTVKVAVR